MMSQLKKDKIEWAKAKVQCMHYVATQSQVHANDMRYVCFEEDGPDDKERPEVIKKLSAVAMAFGVARFMADTEEERPFLKELMQDIIIGTFVDEEPFSEEEYREISSVLSEKEFDNLFVGGGSGEIH